MKDVATQTEMGIETPSVLAMRESDFVVVSAAPFWTPARFWLLIGAILFAAAVLVFWGKSHEKAKAEAVQRERLGHADEKTLAIKRRVMKKSMMSVTRCSRAVIFTVDFVAGI